MWVRITKNCITPLGPRYEGEQADLNEVTLKDVPKDCYKRCLAPWKQAQKDAKRAAEEEAARKAAEDAAVKDESEPPLPEPPKAEDIGEAEIPKEIKTDGPEKTKDKKPERKPPKKH